MLNSSNGKYSVNRTQNRKTRLNNSLSSKNSSILDNVLRGSIDNFQSTGQFTNTIDFSKFENHVFFDSAVSKVNYAFHQVLNYFPLEENKSLVDDYFNNFDGYTKYIFDNKISKSKNALRFDGNSEINVKNSAGYIFSLSETNKEKIGKKVFSPGAKQLNFDFWIYPDPTPPGDGKYVIFQCLSETGDANIFGSKGFTCFIESEKLVFQISNEDLSNSETNKTIQFSKAKCSIELEKFSHISINVKTKLGKRVIEIFKNGVLETESIDSDVNSPSGLDFSELDLSNNNTFSIGSAKSSHIVSNIINYSENLSLDNLSRFTGILDEFRFFHKTRTASTIVNESKRNIFDQEDLVFCFRFNEPPGVYTNNNVVLDNSNNALHSIIKIQEGDSLVDASKESTNTLRDIASLNIATPLVFEDEIYSPVIFPEFQSNVTNNSSLLEEAAIYDEYNPNLIFKLMPTHYFINSAIDENFNTIYGDIKKSFSPGRTQLGNIQLPNTYPLVNLLVVWARFFDNIKIYLDTFTDLLKTSIHDATPNRPLLIRMCKLLGLEFKDLFDDTGILNKKYFSNDELSDTKIDEVQNEIWKRILSSTNQFKVTKGTRQSIKSLIHSLGLNADQYFDIKEISDQQTFISSDNVYDLKNKQVSTKAFDFSKNTRDFTLDTGFFGNRISFVTDSIGNIRYEEDENENLIEVFNESFVKDSWTVEGYYRFNKENLFLMPLTQSLFRINATNTPADPNAYSFDNSVFVFNVLFHKDKPANTSGRIIAIGNPCSNHLVGGVVTQSDKVNIEVEDIDLQNGNIWHIALARKELERGSEYTLFVNEVKNKDTTLEIVKKTQKTYEHIDDVSNTRFVSIFDDTFVATAADGNNLTFDKNFNVSVGLTKNNSTGLVGNDFSLHNNVTINSKVSNKEMKFFGHLIGINVWSKSLSEQEVLSHSKNFMSFSTELPHDDYSLMKTKKGLMYSFYAESFINNIAYDLSQKNISTTIKVMNASAIESNLLGNEVVNLTSYVSSTKNLFGRLPLNNENIIINSLEDEEKAKLLRIEKTPRFTQSATNTNKFSNSRVLSVEMSNVKHLNEDIDLYTASVDTVNSLVSNNDILYCESYQGLNDLSNTYFKRHTSSRIDNQPLVRIFRFCDNILNSMLKDFVPDNMIFFGTNYVIESHSLERHKYTYKSPASLASKNDLESNISNSYLESRRH